MQTLVDRVQASPQARERAKGILLTLCGEWSVRDGCRSLGVRRTRFQDLRRRLLEAAAFALEERATGRPLHAVDAASRERRGHRRRLAELERELARTRAELDIARGAAAGAVQTRLLAKGGRR